MNRPVAWGALVLTTLLIGAPAPAAALEPVVLSDAAGEYRLGLHLELLEDPDHGWTIADVNSPAMADRFIRSDKEVPNLGMARGDTWVRFRLRNSSATRDEWLLTIGWPVVDRVELYTPEPSGAYRVRAAGELVPFTDWEIDHRQPTFAITVPAGADSTFYVRFHGEDTMILPLSVWSPEAFEAACLRERFWFGIYYGVVLAMVLYNFQLFVLLRDPAYILYGLAMSAFALYQSCLDGLMNQYFWPSSPWWATRSLHVFATLTLYCTAIFARSFLGTAHSLPRFDRFARVMIWLFFALIPWSFFGPVGAIAASGSICGVVAAVAFAAAAIIRWRQGYTPARYYLLAWSLLSILASAQALRGFGFLPSNPLTDHGLQIAVLVLSLDRKSVV